MAAPIDFGSDGNDPVRCFLEDHEGNLWFGCDQSGLHRWQPRRIQSYTTQDGLAGDLVNAVHQTRDGSLWIGTETGLSRFQSGQFTNYTHAERRRNIVRSLAEDADGNLWIGTLGDGVDCFRDGAFTHYPLPGELPGNKVRALAVGHGGALWIGTAGGLHRLHDGQITTWTKANGIPHNEVSALHEDRRGRLWLGTEGGGLALLDRRGSRGEEALTFRSGLPAPCSTNDQSLLTSAATLRMFTMTNGLPSDRVWALHEDSDGVVWIGTERGLARVDLTSLRNSRGDEALTNRFQRPTPSSPIDQSLLTPAATITSFTKAHGLYDETINEIIEDDFGRLWLSSDRGIMRVDKRELNAIAAGATNRVNCVVYTESDGMLSHESNGQRSQPAACKARDGRLWFATTRGVAIIDPRKLDELDTRPPVSIERIAVDGETIFENLPGSQLSTNNYQLSPGHGRLLEIHFTASTFKAPEKVRFRYRLSGFDSAWTEAETRRVAYFTNLKPGAYRLEVVAANNHSLWSKRSAEFSFTLAPQVWQTTWFQPVCWSSALAAFICVVLHLRRMHRVHQRAALSEERARIARDMHDSLGSQLSQVGLALASATRGNPATSGTTSELLLTAERTLDEIVWTMRSTEDRLDRLAIYLAQHGHEHVTAAGLEFEMDMPEVIPDWPLSAPVRKEILLTTKEALTNAIRHSRARKVTLHLAIESAAFVIEITDDGRGFRVAQPSGLHPQLIARSRNGIENMRHRIQTCGGQFEIVSGPGLGTKVHFKIPRFS